jgi:flagellar basal-body rod protein FlgG
MYPALWISKTGLDAQQTNMAVISNNLANVNTTGFKRDRAVFEDLMYQNIRQVGANSTQDTELPSGLMLGTGVRTVATQKQHSQGNIIQTNNALDVAIQGKGYFQVLHPDGNVVYTRDGQFALNADGQLVTANGYQVEPAVTIDANAVSITIGSDGIVSVLLAGSTAPTNAGQLELANFANPQGLEPIGDNLFRETVSSGAPLTAIPGNDSLGTLNQGSLESSNVISATDQMLGYVSSNL